MENELMDMREEAAVMMQNTHTIFDLSGWPAAAVLITACLSCVAIHGLNTWYKLNCNS